MNRKIISLFALLFFTCLIADGCKSKSGNQTSQQTEEQKVQQNTTDGNAPQTNLQSDKTDVKTNELGIKQGVLPADYPSDIPKPKDSKVLGSLNTSEGMTVTFESTAKPKEILADFTSVLDKGGFKKDGEEQMKDNGGMVMWKKDKREVSLMLAWDDTKKSTSTVVTYR